MKSLRVDSKEPACPHDLTDKQFAAVRRVLWAAALFIGVFFGVAAWSLWTVLR